MKPSIQFLDFNSLFFWNTYFVSVTKNKTNNYLTIVHTIYNFKQINTVPKARILTLFSLFNILVLTSSNVHRLKTDGVNWTILGVNIPLLAGNTVFRNMSGDALTSLAIVRSVAPDIRDINISTTLGSNVSGEQNRTTSCDPTLNSFLKYLIQLN